MRVAITLAAAAPPALGSTCWLSCECAALCPAWGAAACIGIALAAGQAADAPYAGQQTRAIKALGAEVVRLEGELDALFASGKPLRETVEAKAAGIGLAQARYRASDLTTHIETARAMTAEQIARYDRLRGYAGGGHGGHAH